MKSRPAPFSSLFPVLAVLAILAAAPAGAQGTAKIAVTLSPAGSFVAESAKVIVAGYTRNAGDSVSAQNVELELNTLETGIGLRDRHMRERYFETGKYPKAVLRDAQGKGGRFTGHLELHGVTRPISGTYEIQGGQLVSRFNTKLSDFKIAPAKYLGVGVADEVSVEIALKAAGEGSAPAAAPAPAKRK